MKKLLLFLLSVIAFQLAYAQQTSSSATSYYSKPTGSLSDLTTWGNNTDGSGTNPPNFDTAIFNLANRGAAYELTSDWIVRWGTINLPAGTELKLNGRTLSVLRLTNLGTITGSPTSNLLLAGTPDMPIMFTGGFGSLANLMVGTDDIYHSSATATLASPLNIYQGLVIARGTLNTKYIVTLKSTQAGTATLRQNDPYAAINGNITVEKYIPARRAWRFINAPVTRVPAATVNRSWQEGATTASANPNPNPGFGTYITGGSTSDGFDQSPSNTPSIKRYNAATNTWVAVSSTNSATVSSDTPYMVFIRGDRSINLNNEDSATPTSTVLRATGNPFMTTNYLIISVNPGFTAVGNPFQGVVEIIQTTADIQGMYVWDSKMGGTQGVGGWVYVNGGNFTPAPVGSVSSRIQPWQSFMIYSERGGYIRLSNPAPTNTPAADVFVTSPQSLNSSLRINLMINDTGNTKAVRDGVRLDYRVFSVFENPENVYNIKKLANFTETLGLLRDGKDLLIERRSIPSLPDTIFLKLTNVEKKEYFLQFEPQYFTSDTIAAYLEDSYLHTSTPVSLNSSSIIQFTINDDSASSKSDRFKVIFKDVRTVTNPTPHQTYIANTNMGNHNWSGELGMEFSVNNPAGIVINQLGAFDHQGNGITGTRSGGIEVAIFDKSTHNIVPGLDAIIIGNADHYTANHRMKDVTPVTLPAGNYLVVAKGYNASELYGNTLVSGSPYPTGDAAGGAISFSGTAYWSDNNVDGFSYPTHTMALTAQPYIAGTFNYTVRADSSGTPPPHQAYIANTNTGNHNWSGELGMEFSVNNPAGIIINQLGAFDHQGNGITGTRSGGIEVAIFDKNTHNIVPGLDAIIIGNADHYSANHRMKDITPVTLPVGNYLVVAKGYNASELYGNTLVSGSPYPTGDAASGAISFSGTAYWGDNNADSFSYPAYTMALTAQPYIAGTFNYTVPADGGTPTPHQAYIANTNTGNHNWSGELGMEFSVNNPGGIVINQLGAFDHQGNGITGTRSGGIEVAIFDKSTHNIVPGLDAIIIGNADHYRANHRMKDITPVTLPVGNYLVVAKGYNASELYGNTLVSGSPYPTGDAAGGAISFSGTAYWSDTNVDGFSYPTHTMALQAQPYTAGTFNYTVPAGAGSQLPPSITGSKILEPLPALMPIKSAIKVFPNPNSGQFNIQLLNVTGPKATVQVLSETGRLIKQKLVDLNGKPQPLIVPMDIGNGANGMYLIKVISADGVQTGKVLVHK